MKSSCTFGGLFHYNISRTECLENILLFLLINFHNNPSRDKEKFDAHLETVRPISDFKLEIQNRKKSIKSSTKLGNTEKKYLEKK